MLLFPHGSVSSISAPPQHRVSHPFLGTCNVDGLWDLRNDARRRLLKKFPDFCSWSSSASAAAFFPNDSRRRERTQFTLLKSLCKCPSSLMEQDTTEQYMLGSISSPSWCQGGSYSIGNSTEGHSIADQPLETYCSLTLITEIQGRKNSSFIQQPKDTHSTLSFACKCYTLDAFHRTCYTAV
jgi:hypothetical protein